MFPTTDRFNFHKKNQSFNYIICNYKTERRRCHVARRTIQEPSYPREIYSYANDRFSQRKFEIDPFFLSSVRVPPIRAHAYTQVEMQLSHTIANTKKKTRIQYTRLARLSFVINRIFDPSFAILDDSLLSRESFSLS